LNTTVYNAKKDLLISEEKNENFTYNTRLQTSKAIFLNQTNFMDECELKEIEDIEEFDINSDDEIFNIKHIGKMKINPFLPNKSLTSLNKVDGQLWSFSHKNNMNESSENLGETETNEYVSYTKVRDLVAYLGKNEIK